MADKVENREAYWNGSEDWLSQFGTIYVYELLNNFKFINKN